MGCSESSLNRHMRLMALMFFKVIAKRVIWHSWKCFCSPCFNNWLNDMTVFIWGDEGSIIYWLYLKANQLKYQQSNYGPMLSVAYWLYIMDCDYVRTILVYSMWILPLGLLWTLCVVVFLYVLIQVQIKEKAIFISTTTANVFFLNSIKTFWVTLPLLLHRWQCRSVSLLVNLPLRFGLNTSQ